MIKIFALSAFLSVVTVHSMHANKVVQAVADFSDFAEEQGIVWALPTAVMSGLTASIAHDLFAPIPLTESQLCGLILKGKRSSSFGWRVGVGMATFLVTAKLTNYLARNVVGRSKPIGIK